MSIVGSVDMGLEEVENACSLVEKAANPDANIIFGASFDETMEDEIRVIVIATDFEGEGAGSIPQPKAEPAAEKPRASRKNDDDGFGDILNIFR